MPENPLDKLTFTQGYELSGSDVVAQLSSAFGVADEEIFAVLPQLRNSEDRKYHFRRPPANITPREESDIIVMLEGTDVDPLATFVIKTLNGLAVYTYTAFWQDYFGGTPKIE